MELRALTSKGEEGEDEEELWQEEEKKLLEDKQRRASEAARKKQFAQNKDHQARRMTVDGRAVQVRSSLCSE